MFIVADSGSTKTIWALVENGKTIQTFKTKGLNPYFVNSGEIFKTLTLEFPPDKIQNKVHHVYFYGAGCSSDNMKQIIFNGLKKYFINSEIEINTDLLGAARALFKKEKGIAAIIGTGSNTGAYNGRAIVQSIKSLGYALGDEGSGAHLGKLLITDYLHDDLPQGLQEKFETEYALSKDDIIYSIYKKPFPSKFMASFATFLNDNKNHPHIKNLINKSLQQLFEKYICRYPNYKNLNLGFVGSVAYYIQPELEAMAKYYGIKITQVIKEPLKGLVEFHLQ